MTPSLPTATSGTEIGRTTVMARTEAERIAAARSGARRTALTVGVIALAVYVAFILKGVLSA